MKESHPAHAIYKYGALAAIPATEQQHCNATVNFEAF